MQIDLGEDADEPRPPDLRGGGALSDRDGTAVAAPRPDDLCHSPPRMCCLVLTAGLIGPRIALLVWWIFGDKVDLAFDSWIWPLLGLLFLPWTTLAYVLVWSPVVGVDGAEWIVVALGFVLDVLTYSGRAARSRYATSQGY
jgi:hypothetical protein